VYFAGGFMSSRRNPLMLGIAAISFTVLWFVLLAERPLFDPDEDRYAEIPREMLSGGDWVIPHLNGFVYLEKPPLQYWITVLCAVAAVLFAAPVVLVDHRDEFDLGLTLDPTRGVATLQEFSGRWRALRDGFAVMPPGTQDRLLAASLPMREIARFPTGVLISRR
jgi:hypothetical protein